MFLNLIFNDLYLDDNDFVLMIMIFNLNYYVCDSENYFLYDYYELIENLIIYEK